MEQNLAGPFDVDLQNVVNTRGSRKREHANKGDSLAEQILEDSGDHNTDPGDRKEEEIRDFVCRQNVEVEDENSMNDDGKVVDLESEFDHAAEEVNPTDQKDDKADDIAEHTRPMNKLMHNDTECGVMVNDNKEDDPSLNKEEYSGEERTVLTPFDHVNSEDMTDRNEGNQDSMTIEEHQLVNSLKWYEIQLFCTDFPLPAIQPLYSLSKKRFVLWMDSELKIVLDISTCHMSQELSVVLVERRRVLFDPSHLSSGGTINEMNHEMPRELMPDCCQRDSKHPSYQDTVTPNNETLDVSAVSDLKRKEVTHAWKEWMTPVTEPIRDGKMDLKWYLNIPPNHPLFQLTEFTVRVIPVLPRHYFPIYIPFQGAVPVSDLDDQITHESEADAYAVRQIGYTTDPLTTIAPTSFEIDNLRLGGLISPIEQETDQQNRYRFGLRMTQNESSRATGNDNPPAHALPPICSSRSSGQSSLTAGSGFEQEQSPSETESPSGELCSLWDAHGTQDICSIRSTGHDHSRSQLTSNDTQKEVEALKEEVVRNNGGGNQALKTSNQTAPAVPAKEAPNNSGATNSTSSKDLPGSMRATDGNFKGAVSTQSPGSLEIRKNLMTDAAQSVLDMGYQPKLVLRAIEWVLKKKGSEDLTGQIIMEAIFEIDEENKSQSKTQPVSLQSAEGDKSMEKGAEETENASSEESQLDPEEIKREHRELHEATLCQICMENTISVVFLPCGHLVTCSDCAPAMRKCPICRTLIKGTVKTFYG